MFIYLPLYMVCCWCCVTCTALSTDRLYGSYCLNRNILRLNNIVFVFSNPSKYTSHRARTYTLCENAMLLSNLTCLSIQSTYTAQMVLACIEYTVCHPFPFSIASTVDYSRRWTINFHHFSDFHTVNSEHIFVVKIVYALACASKSSNQI